MDDKKHLLYGELYVEFYDLREAINKAFIESFKACKSYKNYFGEQVDQRRLKEITDITFTRTTEFENRIKKISNLFQALHEVDAPKQTKTSRKERKGLKLI